MLIKNGLIGSHHIHLVIISVLVAIVASYAAINLISRITANTMRDKWLLLGSSVLMGGGIWTMHFIGMLAFHLGIPVMYNIVLVIVSFGLAVVSSIISFWFFVKRNNLFLSSLIMGLGIVGMHYTGMKSMVMAAEVTYEPILFAISIGIAIVASRHALLALSKYRNGKISGKIGSSIFLGIAVSSMHYAGMSATKFTSHVHEHGNPNGLYSGTPLAIASGLFIFLSLLVILKTSHMDELYTWKLKESEERNRRLVEQSPIGIAIHKSGILTYVNPAGMKIMGADTPEDLVNRNVLDFMHPDFHETVKARWMKVIEQKEALEPLEEKMIRLDKQIIDVEITGIPITNNGETLVQVFFQDITDRKRAEKLVYQLAYHDSLTKLPNRRLFLERLNETLIDLESSHRTIAVMFIDLDGFKKVNDTLGHDAGDLLLIDVAKRLTSCVSMEATVSRLAGDEFVILLPCSQQKDAIVVAKRIIEVLGEPININDNEIHITSSIGISVSHHESRDAETLLKQADIAMYQAKKQGKNNYQLYIQG